MKLIYITNIPTPYRQKRFNVMNKIFPKYGIDFEVMYMAANEPNRTWVVSKESFNYKYKVFKGFHLTIGRFYVHFNWGILYRLLKGNYDIVIIGGMGTLTAWLAPFFVRKSKIQIMSIESNLLSVQRKSGIGAWLKRKMLKKATAYQVTGTPQIEYIKYFYKNAEKKTFIKLPNLIDENIFKKKVEELRDNRDKIRLRYNLREETQVWVLPAQLVPRKGIIPFLKLLEDVKGIMLFILGEGELRREIEQLIEEKELPVKLLGFLQQDDIISYYALADLFVLPTIKDPSPLSPIEALSGGLPLLVSSRIGNLEDVLEENINGWSYDPISEEDKGRQLVSYISQMSVDELKYFGRESTRIYKEKFDTTLNIVSYAENLLRLLKDKK